MGTSKIELKSLEMIDGDSCGNVLITPYTEEVGASYAEFLRAASADVV